MNTKEEEIEMLKEETQKQQAVIEKLRAALEVISGKKTQTRLAGCCVEKSCHINSETGSCSFQTGINYGYCDAAGIAEEALKEVDEVLLGP